MSGVDAGLWALAVVLFALALWWGRPRPRRYSALWLYEAVRGARRGVVPVSRGDEEPLPAAWLGAGTDWARLTGDDPAVKAAFERRFRDVCLVWFEEPALPLLGLEQRVLATSALEPGQEAALDTLLPRPSTRLILAARREAGPLIHRLHSLPGLRDHVVAVVLIGPELSHEGEWLAAHFTHVELDTELDRVVPWLVLRVGTDAESQRLVEPALPDTGRRSFEIIDLGAVAEAQLDPEQGLTLSLVLAGLRGS